MSAYAQPGVGLAQSCGDMGSPLWTAHKRKDGGVFFDEATIEAKGGDGGNGCVSFRREKFVPLGGPNGGNGAPGGSVYLRVSAALNTLVPFARRRHFRAESGGHGLGKGMQGADGPDLYVDVPAGTVVRDQGSGEVLGDLTEPGQVLLVARGGRGGRGNESFKSPTRQAPRFAERGEPGEERLLRLELRLIADVGIVGKPNAGKSTLLAAVSAAKPKIADYPFTTLSPSLGVVTVHESSFVLADLPGLIEGAHAGAGLGLEFLRHVERTRLLLHLLDGAAEDPATDFRTINSELRLYAGKLAAKPQVVALSKMDLPEARERYRAVARQLRDEEVEVYAISAATGQGLRELLLGISRRLAALPAEPESETLHVFRPGGPRDAEAFTVQRVAPGVFRVTGHDIERLAAMTDWSSYEGLERFQRVLQGRGIAARLQEEGVQLGDTVFIGDHELEWR